MGPQLLEHAKSRTDFVELPPGRRFLPLDEILDSRIIYLVNIILQQCMFTSFLHHVYVIFTTSFNNNLPQKQTESSSHPNLPQFHPYRSSSTRAACSRTATCWNMLKTQGITGNYVQNSMPFLGEPRVFNHLGKLSLNHDWTSKALTPLSVWPNKWYMIYVRFFVIFQKISLKSNKIMQHQPT